MTLSSLEKRIRYFSILVLPSFLTNCLCLSMCDFLLSRSSFLLPFPLLPSILSPCSSVFFRTPLFIPLLNLSLFLFVFLLSPYTTFLTLSPSLSPFPSLLIVLSFLPIYPLFFSLCLFSFVKLCHDSRASLVPEKI